MKAERNEQEIKKMLDMAKTEVTAKNTTVEHSLINTSCNDSSTVFLNVECLQRSKVVGLS